MKRILVEEKGTFFWWFFLFDADRAYPRLPKFELPVLFSYSLVSGYIRECGFNRRYVAVARSFLVKEQSLWNATSARLLAKQSRI